MKQILFVICLALAGCATPKQVVSPDTPSLYLAAQCERVATRGPDCKITFPAGEYKPAFRDTGGIFYKCEADAVGPLGIPMEALVYVMSDGAHALGSRTGIPNPLDRPLPFATTQAAKPGATASR